MRFLLDSSACIRPISGRSATLTDRSLRTPKADVGISAIVRGELYFGSAKSSAPDRSRRAQDALFEGHPSVAFDDAAADRHGAIRAALARAGTPIGANDLLIAARTLSRDLTVVTSNTREFVRVPGLRVENWETEPA